MAVSSEVACFNAKAEKTQILHFRSRSLFLLLALLCSLSLSGAFLSTVSAYSGFSGVNNHHKVCLVGSEGCSEETKLAKDCKCTARLHSRPC